MENRQDRRKLKWIAGVGLALFALALGGRAAIRKWSVSVSEEFDAYTERLFKEDVTENTVNLHYTLANPENYGITDYEVTLGSVSCQDMKEGYAELEEMEEELKGFRRFLLTKDRQLTYDILKDYVETELSVKDLALYTEVLGPVSGYQSQLPVILAEYTFRRERDIEDYLALVSGVDELAKELIEFEKEKAKAGLFMSDDAADTVIAQCREFIASPEENYMIEVFDDKLATFEGLSQEKKEEYRERNRRIVTTEVAEGYEILIEGLKELRGSGKNDLGLCYYDDGARYYEYLVRSGTGSDASVRQLMRKTESFLQEYIDYLQRVAQQSPEVYEEFLDYQFSPGKPEEILEDLREKAADYFPEPPEVSYTVKYVHPSMEEYSNPAFYLTTPVDDLDNNLIYINNSLMGSGEQPGLELYSTLAHEGYPGHLYQNIYTGSCGLPLIRSLLSCTGYTEGWATYVEYGYSYQFTGMGEGLARLFAGNGAATLALYAYIDMGIHYEGWDRADVADFLAGYGISQADVAEEVFGAVVAEPASYLNYFTGYLEFLDLRQAAEKELGEDFDIKEFHRFLLETGEAPFYIIEDYMADWIKNTKKAA